MFKEEDHPRLPKGNPGGGEFTMSGGKPVPKYIMDKMDIEKFPTENEFYKKYVAQHVDVRAGVDNDIAEKNFLSISQTGFREAVGPNAMPIQKYVPTQPTIIQQKFGAKKGQTVYIIPKDQVTDTANGYKVKEGWKPTKNEVVKIEYDYQPIYEAYINQKKKYFK